MAQNKLRPEQTESLKYMKQLDGLRALAIATVLYTHYSPASYHLFNIDWGAYGVRLFFVLSGFLITGILLRCRQYIQSGKQTPLTILRQFYIRRCLRIFPIYYITLAIGLLLTIPHLRESIVWHLLYLSNVYFCIQNDWFGFLGPFWSLAVEEQFYIFWPWLVIFLPKKALLPAIITLILGGPIFRLVGVIFDFNLVLLYGSTPAVIDSLGFGALLAYLKYREKRYSLFPYLHNRNPETSSSTQNIVKIYLSIGLPLLLFILFLNRIQYSQIMDVVFRDTGLALIFTWLVAGAAKGFSGIFGKILEFPAIVYLGKISYGMYIVHLFVAYSVSNALTTIFGTQVWNNNRWILVGFISTIITIALATISWHFLEKPINDLKRFFPYTPKTSKATASET
ncbi:MAG TPA: acyltransferase [Kamptonema sp.]|nr:acyltransferase [Kamptonema sp.]